MRMCVCSLVLRLFSLNSVGFGTFWGAVHTHRFQFQVSISIFILPFIFHQQIIFMYLRKDIHYVSIYLQEIKKSPRLSMYSLKSSRDYLNWTMSSLCCRLHDNVNIYNFILFHMACTACAFQLHIQCTLSVFNCG